MMNIAAKININLDRIYTVIFWLSWAMLVAWIIAKLLGLIQTPLWLELFPLIAVGITILTFGMGVGRWKQKVDDGYNKITEVSKQLNRIERKISNIDNNLRDLTKKYTTHIKRYHNT